MATHTRPASAFTGAGVGILVMPGTGVVRSRAGQPGAQRQWAWLIPLVATAALAIYSGVLWAYLRPDFLQSWRETDTQTIARHFTEPGESILYPRIDWGGTGPGYVETEFQLYAWLVSLILRLGVGDAEWPGQLISLLAVVATAWLTYTELVRRYGQLPAALGAAALLSTRGVVQCATTVQPEALCLMLFAGAWFALLRYTDHGGRRWLALYAVLGAAAMLVKPTAAQLGIASFLLLLLQFRHLLRKKDIWIAWGFMVAALVVHLLHGRNVYLEYGNTFGVLSGGDSKLPRLQHLLVPRLYLVAARNSVLWGVGPVGAAALVAALFLRRNTAPIVALLVAAGAWTVLALRYTTFPGGNHYHVLGAVLAAHAVAYALAALAQVRWRRWAHAVVVCAILLHLANSYQSRIWTRSHPWDAPVVAIASAAARHTSRGDLIVVRSVNPRYDTYWRTVVNFEDPRVFYLTKTRGWPIGKDVTDPAQIDRALQQGARFYVEPEARPPMPEFDRWLSAHATLLESTSFGGKVYQISVTPGLPAGRVHIPRSSLDR